MVTSKSVCHFLFCVLPWPGLSFATVDTVYMGHSNRPPRLYLTFALDGSQVLATHLFRDDSKPFTTSFLCNVFRLIVLTFKYGDKWNICFFPSLGDGCLPWNALTDISVRNPVIILGLVGI